MGFLMRLLFIYKTFSLLIVILKFYLSLILPFKAIKNPVLNVYNYEAADGLFGIGWMSPSW